MDEENDFFLNKEEQTLLISKCEQMLSNNEELYFDVFEFSELLDIYIEEGKLNKAFSILRIAEKQHPNNSEIDIRKAKIHIERNDADTALSILLRLQKIEADNADILLLIGISYTIKKEYEKAIAVFESFIEVEPEEDIEDSLYNIAVTFLNYDQHKYALYFLKKAFKLNPNNPLVIYDVAYCYEKVDRLKKSIEFYEHYINLDPYSENAWYNLGVIYTKVDKLEKAIEAFDYSIAINDVYSSAYFNKANCLANLDRYAEAIPEYLEFLKQEPENILANLYLAESYEKTDDFEQAEAYFQEVINLNCDYGDGWFGLAVVKTALNDFKTSKQCFEKAIELDPENNKYWMSYALLLKEANRDFEAMGAFKKAISIDPDNSEAWIELSHLEAQLDIKQAIKTLKEANKQLESAEVLFTLAAFQENIDETIDALRNFQKAYDIYPAISSIFFDICTKQNNELKDFGEITY